MEEAVSGGEGGLICSTRVSFFFWEKIAALLCVGFVLGGWLGAKIATGLPAATLQKIFGVALLLISAKMILGK